jgi:hypothetical protein
MVDISLGVSRLQRELDSLFSLMCGRPGQPPIPRKVLIVALSTEMRHGHRLKILNSSLRTPDAFVTEFDSLLGAGYSWINLSYCGLLADTAVVTLEHSMVALPGRSTPVNFSGPSRRVADAGWNVLAYIELIE